MASDTQNSHPAAQDGSRGLRTGTEIVQRETLDAIAGATRTAQLVEARRAESLRAQEMKAIFEVEGRSFRRPARVATAEEIEEFYRPERERREAIAQRRERRRREIAAIPPEFLHARLDDAILLPTDASSLFLDAAGQLKRLLSEPAHVILIGPNGTCKTHLACACLNYFLSEGRTCAYVYGPGYFDQCRREFRVDATDVLKDVGLVVIDEPGRGFRTDTERSMVQNLVDARYRDGRASIIVVNDREDELVGLLGNHIVDRVKDRGWLIEANWPSVRGRISRVQG